MISLVSLLATAALLSLQCYAYAKMDENLELNNNLLPNDKPSVRLRWRNNLKIEKPPPETVRPLAGSTMVLECSASGIPAPTINWMKNGVTISDFEEDGNEIITNPGIAQIISKLVVRLPTNGDVYTCVAVAGLYERRASTTVIFEGDQSVLLTSMMPIKPIITAYYEFLMQDQGTSATLPCRVESSIKAEIIWVRETGKVVYGNNRIRILPSGDLHISNLTWKDMGGYICIAQNALGKDTASTFVYPLVLSKHN